MFVFAFLWSFGFSVVFSVTFHPIICSNPGHKYNIILEPGKTIAMAKNPASNPYSGELTVCFRLMSNNNSIKTPIVFTIPIEISATNETRIQVGIDSKNLILTVGSPDNFIDNSWNTTNWIQRCITHNGTHVKVYKNGKILVTQSALKSTFALNPTYKRHLSVLYHDAVNKIAVNDISYYDRVLSPQEVEAVACEENSVPGNHINMSEVKWCFTKFENVTGKEMQNCNKNFRGTNDCSYSYGNSYVTTMCKAVESVKTTIQNSVKTIGNWFRFG